MKMHIEGKDRYVEVLADRIVDARSGKVYFELGDYRRKVTPENYLKADMEHWYRFHAFYETGAINGPTGVGVKCLALDKKGGTENTSFRWPADAHFEQAGTVFYYWMDLKEFL